MPDEKPESSTGEDQDLAEPESPDEGQDAQQQAEEGAESATAEDESSGPREGETEEPPEGSQATAHEKRGNAETRIRQLNARVKDLERRLADNAKPAEKQPDLVEPKKPKLEDYDTLQDYDAAMDKYVADAGAYREQKAVRDREEKTAREAQAKTEDEARKAWQKRVSSTLKRVPDFDTEEAIAEVKPTAVMDGFFVESDIGPDVLAHLAANPEEAERIREIANPYKAVRELLRIEAQLSERINGKTKPASRPPSYVKGAGASPAKQKSAADVLYG